MIINKSNNETAVIILAAGKSQRMGTPKFFLKYDKNRCFLQKIIEDYMIWGINEIIVVLNPTGLKKVSTSKLDLPGKTIITVNDKHPTSRFYSIKKGLCAIKKATSALIHNVDNPFVEKDVLDSLIANKNKGDYIVPQYKNKGGHPILINHEIIKNTIIEDNYYNNFKEFLNSYTKIYVAANNDKILVNINSPTDFENHFI